MHPEKHIYSVQRCHSNIQQSTKHTGREFGTPLALKSPNGPLVPVRDPYEDWINHEVYFIDHLRNVLEVLGVKDESKSKLIIAKIGKKELKFSEMSKICAKLNLWSTRMEFKESTYFLARYLAFISESKSDLSLSVCLFIADKYEELYMKTWDIHLKFAGVSASNEDFIMEEIRIINSTNFYVHRPRLHYVLIQTLKSSRALGSQIELANSILKVLLIDEKVFTYSILKIVQIVIYMVAKSTGNLELIEKSDQILGKRSNNDDEFKRYFRLMIKIINETDSNNDPDISPFKLPLNKILK